MRFFSFVLVALAMLVIPARAFAQTIVIQNEQSLPRLASNGDSVQKRPVTLNPEGVSHQDCVEDQRIRFTIQLTGGDGQAAFQAWAGLGGADCGVQTNRTGVNAVCWELVAGIPIAVNTQVDLPVRKIMSGAPPNTPVNRNDSASVCGTVDLANISVQFLYFKPGELATPAVKKDIQVTVDTVGPSPPSGLRVSPGNGRLSVEWANISGEGGLSVLTGVRVYCDVEGGPTSTQTTVEGGTVQSCEAGIHDASNADSDVDAAFVTCAEEKVEDKVVNSTTDCASQAFTPRDNTPIIPDAEFDRRYLCGSYFGNSGAGAIADSLEGKPLKNNEIYAVAVAATDAFGNNGPLSAPKCEFPEQTNDFWDTYRQYGGQGGGGFCTVSDPGAPVGSILALSVFGLVLVSAIRRRSK